MIWQVRGRYVYYRENIFSKWKFSRKFNWAEEAENFVNNRRKKGRFDMSPRQLKKLTFRIVPINRGKASLSGFAIQYKCGRFGEWIYEQNRMWDVQIYTRRDRAEKNLKVIKDSVRARIERLSKK